MDPSRISLRHLRAFLAVAEAGSATGAATAINLTQSAVTQAIARLERDLALPLFQRLPRGMALTEAGRMLAIRAAAVFRLIEGPPPSTVQMNAFLAVADAGTYSAAAAATGLSESALHRAVSDLSSGTRDGVLERRGRGLALTAKGRGLARRLRLGRAELRSAIAELAELEGRDVGRIVVGAMPLSRARPLPAALAAFASVRPLVDVAIVEGSYVDLVGPLRDGQIDIMIGALRPASVAADLLQTPLFDDHPVITGRPGHPLSTRPSPPTAEDLMAFPWIVPAEGTPLRAQWNAMFAAVGATPPRVPIECGSMVLIRDLLVRGDYLTLLSPSQIAVELRSGWLQSVATPPGDLRRTIGVTVRSDWRPTKAQRQFLQILVAEADI